MGASHIPKQSARALHLKLEWTHKSPGAGAGGVGGSSSDADSDWAVGVEPASLQLSQAPGDVNTAGPRRMVGKARK